jgi:hypothetical protein
LILGVIDYEYSVYLKKDLKFFVKRLASLKTRRIFAPLSKEG